jgi:hypothetical protein
MSTEQFVAAVRTMLSCVAPRTLRTYMGQLNRYVRWELSTGSQRPALPFCRTRVMLYLLGKAQEGVSIGTIDSIIASMTFLCNLTSFPVPFLSSDAKMFYRGLRRSVARPTSRKRPVDTMMLVKIVRLFAHADASLSDLRTALVFVLGFAGFFRSEELRNIKIGHVNVASDFSFFRISIPKSKADQLRQGREVLIAATGGETCPLMLLLRYMNVSKVSGVDALLLQGLVNRKGFGMCCNGKGLSYNAVRAMVRKGLKSIGENPAFFGTHSLRAGGASAAAMARVSDRLLQAHGRWARSSSKNMYVVDAVNDRLNVTRRIMN